MHSTLVWALLSIALVVGSIRSRDDHQARVVVGISPVVVIVVVPVVDVSLRLVRIGVVAISVASSVTTVAIPRRAIDNYSSVVSVCARSSSISSAAPGASTATAIACWRGAPGASTVAATRSRRRS